MSRFRTRRFEPGDAAALNDAYQIAARPLLGELRRSLALMDWIWYRGPGGPVDSWVVEAEQPDGSWQIVGHHGLCPVRFTRHDRDLLFAKTINSFLLPEFRSQFLYIRFERQCLEEATTRYDAMYTRGVGAVRLRRPLGYVAADNWIHLEHGSRFDLAARLFSRFVERFPSTPWRQLARRWADSARARSNAGFDWTELTSAEALASPFFIDFWQQARMEAGLSPRRDVPDLAWRFWQRPDSAFVTLIHSWTSGARAYCIVEPARRYLYILKDIFVTPPRPELLHAAFDALFKWCGVHGALTLTFKTAAHGHPPQLMEVFHKRMRPHPLSRFRRPWEFAYAVSPQTKELGIGLEPWNTTDLLLPEEVG